ncbi:hypothetical protein HYR99_22115 [Candidatus Poribacteria bacterium]|nr:hypothetical protein [Candidatus Poribacteria bacterium]
MLTIIEGVYRSGKIELAEMPSHVCEGTPVIVTFLPSSSIDLQARGIDEAQAADLRARLATFAEDWESPEMSLYDNYDAAKAPLQTG